jgi:hypothetical protein
MPRRPQPQYEDHPLKQLRRLLCPVFGVNDSFNQKALGRLTGIAPRTIQAIEMGARTLSPSLLHKILLETGAHWNGKAWTQGPTNVPFTAEGCRQYRAAVTTVPSDIGRAMDLKLLQAKIALLFEHCSDKNWNRLLFAIQDALEAIRVQFGQSQLAECFQGSDLSFDVFVPKTGEVKVIRFHPASPEYLDTEALKRGEVKLRLTPGKRSSREPKKSKSERASPKGKSDKRGQKRLKSD